MSIVTMILSESGAGKSASMRNMNTENTLLIQSISKPLPFRSKDWKPVSEGGNVFVSDNSESIVKAMQKTKRSIIVIDDFQYVLSNEFMRRVTDVETGNAAFAKYNEIARHAWDIINAAKDLPSEKRVYILSHATTDDFGKTKIKTIGKLLDEKIVLEGMVTIVLRALSINGSHVFSTRNNNDTVKTPMGLFDTEHIDNDLNAVDIAIKDYYLN